MPSRSHLQQAMVPRSWTVSLLCPHSLGQHRGRLCMMRPTWQVSVLLALLAQSCGRHI